MEYISGFSGMPFLAERAALTLDGYDIDESFKNIIGSIKNLSASKIYEIDGQDKELKDLEIWNAQGHAYNMNFIDAGTDANIILPTFNKSNHDDDTNLWFGWSQADGFDFYKLNKVVKVDENQDFTNNEKAQGRANIDAAAEKGFVECYRRFNDNNSEDIWFKICELDVGTSDSYAYEYELALKLVCTNNGGGDCPCESATVSMSYDAIPAINVGRAEVAWDNYTKNSHERASILGIKVLSHRASSNYGPRDKIEVWIKMSTYMTYYTHIRIECLMNAGSRCYRSNYSSPSNYILPFKFANSLITGTHTDPFNDSNHPAAEPIYSGEGWSEVWYPVKTNTVSTDIEQTFTNDEKTCARRNIGAVNIDDIKSLDNKIGKLFTFLENSPDTDTGNLHWTGTEWTFVQ